MDREAWHAAIHGVAKSWARLSDWNELNHPPSLLLMNIWLFPHFHSQTHRLQSMSLVCDSLGPTSWKRSFHFALYYKIALQSGCFNLWSTSGVCTSSLLPTILSMYYLLGYLNFANLLTVKWLSHHLSFFGYYRCLASFLSSLVMQVPVSVSYLFIPSFQFSMWLCFCQRNIQDSNLSWFWRWWTPSPCLWLVFLHCLVLVLFFFFIPLLILTLCFNY